MKTILIANQKGGTGKTTIADELAFAFERENVPYSFCDLDGQGGTIHSGVSAEDAAVQIVDTPGRLEENLGEWFKAADLILIPTRMSSRDIPSLQTMLDTVERNDAKGKVIIVLNGWNRFRACQDFEEQFNEAYPDNKIVKLPQSEAFVNAGNAGVSVFDIHTKNKKVTQGINDLMAIIKYELNIR